MRRRRDDHFFEQLLDGGVDPLDAPPEHAALATLLRAAAAPPRPGELEGEAAVRAQFLLARQQLDREAGRERRRRLRPVLVMAVVAASVIGTSIAAATGSLPSILQDVAHEVFGPFGVPPADASSGNPGSSGRDGVSNDARRERSDAVEGTDAGEPGSSRAAERVDDAKPDAQVDAPGVPGAPAADPPGDGTPAHGGTPPGQGGTPPGLGGPPPGQGGTPPGQDGSPPPGHGGTPPGQDGSPPPGHGGTPPGQGGTPPGRS